MIFHCQKHPSYNASQKMRKHNLECYDCRLVNDFKYLEGLMIGARNAANGASSAAMAALYVANLPVTVRR